MNNATNYGPQHTIDTAEITRRAKRMDIEALAYSANDAHEAALAAEEMERAGLSVSKTGGFYRDEATVYRLELGRRLSALADGDELTIGQEVLVRRLHGGGTSRAKVKAIDVKGQDVRVIKKATACREGVEITLDDGTWAYGYQVAAANKSERIEELRRTNSLGSGQ